MIDSLYGKRVLVTGHTGFKGSWLSKWLTLRDCEVSGLSRDLFGPGTAYDEFRISKIVSEEFFGDVADFSFVREVLSKVRPNVIFHLAAQPIVSVGFENPMETFRSNMTGTLNLLEAIREMGRPVVCVIITSDKVYRNLEWEFGYRESDVLGGADPYSASKGGAELIVNSYTNLCESFGARVVSVRAGNVIGGGDWAADRLVPDIFRALDQKEVLRIRNPLHTRPWQHVLEPLSGYLRVADKIFALSASEYKEFPRAFNFGPPTSNTATVGTLVDLFSRSIQSFTNKQLKVLIEESNFHESGLLRLNCDRAFDFLQWAPRLSLSETVLYCCEWYLSDIGERMEVGLRQILKYQEIIDDE